MIIYCAIKNSVGWYYVMPEYNVASTDTILFNGTEDQCWNIINDINKGIIHTNGNHKSDNSIQPQMNFNHLNQRV